MTDTEFRNVLDKNLDRFFHEFFPQFHLKLPKGKIKKINEYRDYYFPYLTDSIYKSNLCYLLQLLDYQLFLYNTFRPGLSLENSFFYQQIITMGIITESTATALLLNPLIIKDAKDRSLGGTDPQYSDIKDHIIQNPFIENIRLLKRLEVLDTESEDTFQQIRKDIRNLVHIQNWEQRIYESMDYNFFYKRLEKFKNFLIELKEKQKESYSLDKLLTLVHPADLKREFSGQISEYFNEKGYGFIKTDDGPGKVFFHISRLPENIKQIKKNIRVQVQIKKSSQGYEAIRIQEENRHD